MVNTGAGVQSREMRGRRSSDERPFPFAGNGGLTPKIVWTVGGPAPWPWSPQCSLSTDVCLGDPHFLSPSGNQVLGPALGEAVTLNCTAWLASGPHCPQPSIRWLKDGQPLGNGSHSSLHEDSW